MVERSELLNNHLNSLTAVNEHGNYDEDIRNTVNELNKELGIGEETTLSSYSTKELHEELIKREGVQEICIDNEQEAVVTQVIGDVEKNNSIKGPSRILINRD